MCMEPLLRSIEKNQLIGLQEFFNEYSRLTRASELELNADKTEIMQQKSTNQFDGLNELNFDITYLENNYRLTTCFEIKVNGVLFQQNERAEELGEPSLPRLTAS